MEIQAGSIVYSKAGRDKTKMLLVISVSDGYAYVADGDSRRVDKLKKKKLKHLQKTNQVSAVGENITNAEVRKVLAEYKTK